MRKAILKIICCKQLGIVQTNVDNSAKYQIFTYSNGCLLSVDRTKCSSENFLFDNFKINLRYNKSQRSPFNYNAHNWLKRKKNKCNKSSFVTLVTNENHFVSIDN